MQGIVAAQQSSPAQSSNLTAEQQDDANLEQMREEHRSQRRKIVAANLPLTETEAAKFWPLYDRYRKEMAAKVYDVRYALIKEYAQNYANMTEDQADSFITRWLSLDSDNAQIQERYVPEFEKVISRKKTAIFFQVDRRVTTMFDLKLSQLVPLVQP
jgi:Spy/CpxP family protein refolding chaperone